MSETLRELRDYINRRVAEGFDDDQSIVTDAEDYAEDERLELADGTIDELVAGALADHARRQAGWDGPTDCDRLDAAFEALERDGVVARQHFSCCSNCGHSEIGEEIGEAEEEREGWQPEVIGYTFYHVQSTAGVVECGTLYLQFGSVSGVEADTLEVGRRIVAALGDAGLTAEWDGTATQCVCATGLDWKRRR